MAKWSLSWANSCFFSSSSFSLVLDLNIFDCISCVFFWKHWKSALKWTDMHSIAKGEKKANRIKWFPFFSSAFIHIEMWNSMVQTVSRLWLSIYKVNRRTNSDWCTCESRTLLVCMTWILALLLFLICTCRILRFYSCMWCHLELKCSVLVKRERHTHKEREKIKPILLLHTFFVLHIQWQRFGSSA